MDWIYQTSIHLIAAFQNSAPWLAAPMQFFSFLGSEYFILFALPLVYWSIDTRLGIRIGFILLFSTALNDLLKIGLQGPRPYWYSSQVKALTAESSFGIPSGHSQNASAVWGVIAWRIQRTWAVIAAVLLIALIGISRVFLAAHFPQDVLVGWLLGGLTLWAFLALWDRAAHWLAQKTFLQQILLALGASLLIVLCGALLTNALRDYVLPQEWMTNAARAGNPLPDPVSLDPILTSAGALLGLAVGLAWIDRQGGYQAAGPIWKRVLCFLVGTAGVALLYFGLKAVFPSGSSLLAQIFYYLRYALIGAWISGGAPWLFFRIKIANPRPA